MEADTRAAEAAARLSEAVRRGQERERELRGELSGIQAALRDSQARASAAEGDLSRAQVELGGVRAACERLRRDLSEAKGRNDGREREREADIRGLEADVRGLREELVVLRGERDDAVASEGRLRTVAAEAHAIAQEVHESKEKVGRRFVRPYCCE